MARGFKKLFGLGPFIKGPELADALFKYGINAYNNARAKNPSWRPDFSGASLKGLDLSLANLKEANLTRTDLNGVTIDNLEMTDERARPRLAKRGAIVE